MFMSDFVDWVIPDIPKDISQQIHKKVLMVELFMREEQGKQQLLDTWRRTGPEEGEEPCSNHSPAPAAPTPRPRPRTALTSPEAPMALGSPATRTLSLLGRGFSHPPGPGAPGFVTEAWKTAF